MVRANAEVKFLYTPDQKLERALRQLPITEEKTVLQEDIYLYTSSSYFKLRLSDGIASEIIKYDRLTSPAIRQSTYEKYKLENDSARNVAKYIFDNALIAGIVKKRRRRLESTEFLINVDSISDEDQSTEMYSVVEIEWFSGSKTKNSYMQTEKILRVFGVKPYQIIPYSNIHMKNMIKQSSLYRRQYEQTSSPGRLILVDGGSGAGKSTMKDLLVERAGLVYARRDTTRAPRPDDLLTQDYNFIDRQAFHKNALAGGYIEFRDFLFGMSYGLPWREFMDVLCVGSHVLGLINLGNGYFTKKLFPKATLVLLYADADTIRKRLESRGAMTKEQLVERLENNRLAITYADAYDLAIDTSNRDKEEVAELIIRRSEVEWTDRNI